MLSSTVTGGIRSGACNELVACMPVELVLQVNGHDYRGTSALWEYVDSSRALTVPGATILAGWPRQPWGQIGKGPVPPCINVLQDPEWSVDILSLEDMMDDLFRLDSATPPQLAQSGQLRPMVHAAFASMVMYFHERTVANEMHDVRVAMMDAVKKAKLSNGDAKATLHRWGSAIRNKFVVDNMHLTASKSPTSAPKARTLMS